MQITYLGHAGFCIETKASLIIMDPWLSEYGAFDSSWFQYPKNHHMAGFVQSCLLNSNKDKYIYISHEHRDHFDIAFLQSLQARDFTFLLANFSHPCIKLELSAIDYQCKKIVILNDNEPFSLADSELRLFIVDTELNCDSAILFKHGPYQFLNLNDCKIHDRLPAIVSEHGHINIFTAQFSGASWYPTCYEMSAEQYRKKCQDKINSKFLATAQAIEKVKPTIYFPSGGPPCFLDPLLFPINFQDINSYPRAPQLLAYLDKHHPHLKKHTQWMEISPGDVSDVSTLKIQHQSATAADFGSYVTDYAKQYQALFAQRAVENLKIKPKDVLKQLKIALENKINELTAVNEQVKTLLYWRLSELPNEMLCINLAQKTLHIVHSISDINNYWCITTPAWQVNKVLMQVISWPDFALTLRLSIKRAPEEYNTILHGFLMLDCNKIRSFCLKMAEMSAQQERITIEFNNKAYAINRYCPHQCGDLTQGYLEGSCWVCPIHQWKFDLNNSGKCTEHTATIDSICLTNGQGG